MARKKDLARTTGQPAATSEPATVALTANGKRVGRPPSPIRRIQTTARLQPRHREYLQLGARIRGSGATMSDILEELVEDWVRRNQTVLDRAKAVLQPQKLR